MKKFLSIVAVLALVLALAAPAFAAESPVAGINATSPDGEVTAVPSKVTYPEGNADVFDVTVTKDGKEITEGPITVAFEYDQAGQVTGVFVQNKEGGWDQANSFAASSDGKILNVVLPHLSPVAFVLGAASNTEGGNTAKDTKGAAAPAAGGPAAVKSPKTGYNTALWAISAAAMAIAAGVCFSRRKVAE